MCRRHRVAAAADGARAGAACSDAVSRGPSGPGRALFSALPRRRPSADRADF
jgi:hypothetical protein